MSAADVVDKAFRTWARRNASCPLGSYVIRMLQKEGYDIVSSDLIDELGKIVDRAADRAEKHDQAQYAYTAVALPVAAILSCAYAD
jgi:hypothetical protein